MTEAEWLACDDPGRVNRAPAFKWWGFAEPLARPSSRQTRLLAVACAGLVVDRLSFPGAREALGAFERHADGRCAPADLRAARVVAERCLQDCDRRAPVERRHNYPGAYPAERKAALLLREAGRTEPNVPVGQRWGYWDCLGGHCPAAAGLVRDIFGNPFRPVAADPAWRTSDVLALARGIYDEKAFDRLPILADALQDAGCDSPGLLNHLREPGEHVRGCWALDLLL